MYDTQRDLYTWEGVGAIHDTVKSAAQGVIKEESNMVKVIEIYIGIRNIYNIVGVIIYSVVKYTCSRNSNV